MMDLLIVEDDERVAAFMERGLRAEGYRVQREKTGPEGLAAARELERRCRADDSQRAVLILDQMLPGLTGLELCRQLRTEGARLPVLMLTAMDRPEDRVAGLRGGADDYLGKPFAFDELLARLEALGRRSRDLRSPPATRLQVDDLVLDLTRMQAERGGQPLALTARELTLLELLMRQPGRLCSRERILAAVWGTHQDPLTNVVDVFIRRLRSKIDDGQPRKLIHTVRGLGYRLSDGE